MRKGNYAGAKLYFEKALIYNPNYSLLYVNLAVLHATLNDPKEAERNYKIAIGIGTYQNISHYYYGSFLFAQKRYDEAKWYLKSAVNLNPAGTDARMALMQLYSKTEDWGNLKKLAEETLQYLPNDKTCLAYIDAAKNKKTKLDVAIATAQSNPTSDNYISLSLAYYEEGKFHECVTACEKAIAVKPNNPVAYNNICSAYNQLKMYDEAIKACDKAIALDPSSQLAKNNRKAAMDGKK
jgi:protein O-mannosyl-transferase